MSLAKTGYKNAIQGTTRVRAALDENGYLAPTGTTAAGAKSISINKVSAENSLTDNTEVLNFFLTLANGHADSLTNTMAVTWSTTDGEEPTE